ncbi:YqjF family protein [Oceanobacillus sp. CF4.6]|uniref:YqjF family protein n=1 Tax=Oceanobacillus sp. CF4.6 TaxID=3373080 RepID=UPI003EE68953
MRQIWRNVAFTHWPVPPHRLRSLIPDFLKIDTYLGQAWIGMIVFDLESIYLRGIPAFSLTSGFPEINIRTYVTYNGIPGIYFLSIDVNNWASNRIAKRWYYLPYQPSIISIEQKEQFFHFNSIRKKNVHMKSEGSFTPFPGVYYAEKESLDYWLTERYRLYSMGKNSTIYMADIHHKQWPLQPATSDIQKNKLISELQLGVNEYQPAMTHFSNGIDTLFWNIKRLL